MSTETSRDVSHINDEDLLRKMWQDTEDFGRKKEIRAHMYKLREARLRDFYSSGEVNTDIQQTTTRTTTESKSCSTPTHADSLADHSFISMKTKEIRDSESPTRDVSYRITDKELSNQGWNVVTSNEKADDGKSHTTTKIATTSGSDKFEGGKVNFAAKNEQKTSVYKDGDDKNFSKAVGTSTNTVLVQEASKEDENRSFRSSSTKASSSSHYVSEHRSTSGEIDSQNVASSNKNADVLVSQKIYTDNIPSELKQHPNFVEGRTKVTQETKTRPDGTTVTTTRYEISGGKAAQSSTRNHYSSTQQKSSTMSSSQSRTEHESGTSYYTNSQPTTCTSKTVTKTISNVKDHELQPAITDHTKAIHNQHTQDADDATKTIKTTVIKKILDSKTEPHTTKSVVVENIYNLNKELNVTADSSATDRTSVTKSAYNIKSDLKSVHDISDQLQTHDTKSVTTTKMSGSKFTDDSKNVQNEIKDVSSKVNSRQESETTINTEQVDTANRMLSPTRKYEDKPRSVSPIKQLKPNESYETPERRQPIKPDKSELDVKLKPTEGQYETTYRTDFTNKRISVDVSPTHEAFARSLRAVSPDRITKCSSPTRGSLRNSTHSLRSSTSPEKIRHSSRFSPDRRSTSPKKTTSNETITYKTKAYADVNKQHTLESDRTCSISEIDSSTLTRRKHKVSKSRSPSPTSVASDIEFIRNTSVVTDLDTNETIIITQSRPSSLEFTKKTTKRVVDKSQTSPLTDLASPKKSPCKDASRSGSLRNISSHKETSPSRSDKILKRTDTYEERCRQILGITKEVDKRRGSQDKTTVIKKGLKSKLDSTRISSPSKDTDLPARKSPEKKINKVEKKPEKEFRRSPETRFSRKIVNGSPEKELLDKRTDNNKITEFPSQGRISPDKHSVKSNILKDRSETRPPSKLDEKQTKITEFPSQFKKSPERQQSEKVHPKCETPLKHSPRGRGDKPQISEFPSQIRRSPDKSTDKQYYPADNKINRSSIEKESCKITEFPSQIRRSCEKEVQTRYPTDTFKNTSTPITLSKQVIEQQKHSAVTEFPSQIRKSPDKEFDKQSLPKTEKPVDNEFTTQTRKTPEKQLIKEHSRSKDEIKSCTLGEYPSQVRSSPEKEPQTQNIDRASVKPKATATKSPSKVQPHSQELQVEFSDKKCLTTEINKSTFKTDITSKHLTEKDNLSSKLQPQIKTTFDSESEKQYLEEDVVSSDLNLTNEMQIETTYQTGQCSLQKKDTLERDFSSYIKENKSESNDSEFVTEVSSVQEETLVKKKTNNKNKEISFSKDDDTKDRLTSKSKQTPVNKEIVQLTVKAKVQKGSPTKLKDTDFFKCKDRQQKPEKAHSQPKTSTLPCFGEKKSHQRTHLSSSSSTDEEQVERPLTATKITEPQNKVPVNEPLFTKRFISKLGKDDEIQRSDLTESGSQNVLTEVILNIENSNKPNKTVKKDSPDKVINNFLENECKIFKDSPKASSPLKICKSPEKSVFTVIPKKATCTIKTDVKTTKKLIPNEKTKPKDIKKTSEKITLYNVDNLDNLKEDKNIHIRTHRIDDTIHKKGIKTNVSRELNKSPLKRPSKEEPKTTIFTEKKTSEKYHVEANRQTGTGGTPKRHVVTTTITVNPKIRQSADKPILKSTPSKSTLTKAEINSTLRKFTTEFVKESSKVGTTTSKSKLKTTHVIPDQTTKKKPEKKIPTKESHNSTATKSDQKKKCITTKSIIINNDNISKKDVIVDLQRSKSSREPTPDFICPLPVSSDDDMLPRYPDKITEPDDFSPRRKKVSDIPIIEDADNSDLTRITEIDEAKTNVRVDRVEKHDESLLSINKKISKFLDTAEKVTSAKQGPPPKVERPKFEINEDLKSDECLLSVSEKVNKFISTAEHLTASQDLVQRPKSPKCQNYPENDKIPLATSQKELNKPSKSSEIENISDKISQKINVVNKNIRLSRIDAKSSESEEITTRQTRKETTPTRRTSNEYTKIKTETVENKYPRRDSSPKLIDSTPRSTRRPSEEEPRSVLSPTGRLRSTESVQKAKALFENINKDQQILKQKDILSRPSVFEGKKIKTEAVRKLEFDNKEDVLKSTKLLLSRKDRSRSISPEKVGEFVTRRSASPDNEVPGYMKPLDRSLRPNSPHRESVYKMNQINARYTTSSEEKDEQNVERHQTKFGVTLKRTDSGKPLKTTAKNLVEEITESEVEKIYDLRILEELLDKVVDYELRRKIRTQIRLVKKLIAEGKLSEMVATKITHFGENSDHINKKESITHTTYSYEERRKSSEITKIARRSQSPQSTPVEKKTSPATTNTKIFSCQLKKSSPSKPVIEPNSPEWVKHRNLKKQADTSTTTKSTTTIKKLRSSPFKETKPTDVITSSYGVGPTDENGSPLFGLKALRSRNVTDTTKIQGTVIKSQYYSENGQEPVGEISVTNYSNDPKDLGRSEDAKNKGITSVTTTQKFGYKDTPSLKTLTTTRKNNKSCESNENEIETKTTKINRRGSVKALSQKFIENAVEISKSERQSSYPKAGLILRTSSFKESASSDDSREGSIEKNITTKTSSSRTVSAETFLTNRNKVTGVQDVISRMKSEDIRKDDSAEDVEARSLLNKFIGSQVILSGIESSIKSTTATANAKKTTKITTTVTENGKPTTKILTFHHPITAQELESIWEEQTLKLLLEQSSDYEERRKIRARLRQVMAEQEACAELVEKASQDQTNTSFEEVTHTKKISTEGPVATSQVTTKITTQQTSKKPLSPFAKFRQLDKQNSLNTPPSTPKTPSGSGPLFKFTDPAVSQSASTIKDRLLHWCRMKTKEYENIQLDNFSTSWADGLAFCALIHHFLPDAFDYHALTPKNRRHNFTLAFKVADEKADIAPLLDVDDMVASRKPDWKCVFTYVQSIYRRFKDED